MNICPVCHTGYLQKRTLAYLEWHGRNLLVVNRMPAMVCEVCQERVYDYEAIESLQRLLWASLPPVARVATRNS